MHSRTVLGENSRSAYCWAVALAHKTGGYPNHRCAHYAAARRYRVTVSTPAPPLCQVICRASGQPSTGGDAMSSKCFRNRAMRSSDPADWDAIVWTRLLKSAFALQRRIDRATKAGHKRKAKVLTRLLNRSLGAQALAVMEQVVMAEIEGENRMPEPAPKLPVHARRHRSVS